MPTQRDMIFDPTKEVGKARGVEEESEIKHKMSTAHALALIEKMPSAEGDLVNFVKYSLSPAGKPGTRLLQMSKQGTLRGEQPGYGGLAPARDKLNAMIHETQVKLDLELIRCSTYERSQLAYIEKLKQDISTFNAAASAAAAEMLRAQAEISIYQVKLPEAQDELAKGLKLCAEAKLELEKQLKIVVADINVMEKVMQLTDCKSSTMLMLQCVDPETGKKFWKYDDNLIQRMSALTHPESQQMVREAFYPSDEESEGGVPMLALLQKNEIEMDDELANATTPAPSRKKQKAKCSISGSPMCPKLRERFMDIATGINDKKESLEQDLRDLEKRCKEGRARLEAKIALFQTLLKKEETALAQATAEKVNNEEQSRLTQIELNKAMSEYDKMMAECRTNIDNFRTEKCGLEKIRAELYKVKGDKVFIFQDCEVTDWTAGECSATCGGGTQELTRTITVYPVNGAACPPLQATQSCNEDQCPVDCVLDDWSAWSSCSAECGGGVRSQSREVKTTPEHGGEPCGETSKTESCNIQACDVPCELSAWTGWGVCSKACDGGSLTRVKTVATPAIGQGTCPAETSKDRLQTKACNTQPCVNATSVVMTCVAKIDVIILLDGSGSLGTYGWEQSKKAGAALARSMKGDTRLAVILFSGPTTYRYLWMCTGKIQGKPDMENDCGIKWVSHFSTDTDKIATDIEALNFPSKTTLTSLAISTAETELSQGRQDATSIVIVVTDGKPMSKRNTWRSVLSIRRKARLMFVPVGRYVPRRWMRWWASRPWKENIVEIPDFSKMTEPLFLNKIVADACPLLKK